jgi:GTP-binding protein HflX
MLESTESLLPRPLEGQKRTRILTVGFEVESLDELDRLLDTCGADAVHRITVVVRRISPATYVGLGKLEEIAQFAEAHLVDAVVFDVDLSPNQMRNIEKILKKPVVDRPGVIIEIFSQHARTKEAKVQVELAKLQYLYPRLAHFWTHFERQRGGIGNKGMGEKQIEVDRRLVKDRISVLRGRLKEIENERAIQRSGRKDVLKVAIVGYTNAGKSTLLNALTESEVLAEDQLFATLDSSVRTLDPKSHPPVVAIDTVGFISNLPTSLVASFRSTLEEVHQADLLLHVVDASSPQAREQLQVTLEVLKELGAEDKPKMVVLNKMDLLKSPAEKIQARTIAPGCMMVSALNSEQVIQLRDQILDHFKKSLQVIEVVIPYSESRLESQIHAHGSVERQKYLEKGTFYRVRISEVWANKLALERYRT